MKSLKSFKKREPYVPVHDDPYDELKRLVRQHASLNKAIVATHHMHADRKAQRDFGDYKKGDTIPCRLPDDARSQLVEQEKNLQKAAAKLETPMLRNLRKLPIYSLFLSKVAGVGTITAAYLVAYIDIHKATKISSLRRYCGLGINTRGVRDSLGDVKGAGCSPYSITIKTQLYLAMSSMFRVGGGYTPKRGCKYLEVWRNYHFRMQHSERVVDGKVVRADGKSVSAKGFVHETGRRKAADVFVEDLYTVWRAIEGLPVWPSYYAEKLGFRHGGEKIQAGPKMMSVEEALELVGDCDWQEAALDVAAE
jgi:hypothetical protein